MLYADPRYSSGHDGSHRVMYCCSDTTQPDPVVKQVMYGGGKQAYMENIRSYADLQRFSSSGWASIGREIPVLHMKEIIPFAVVPYAAVSFQTHSEWYYHDNIQCKRYGWGAHYMDASKTGTLRGCLYYIGQKSYGVEHYNAQCTCVFNHLFSEQVGARIRWTLYEFQGPTKLVHGDSLAYSRDEWESFALKTSSLHFDEMEATLGNISVRESAEAMYGKYSADHSTGWYAYKSSAYLDKKKPMSYVCNYIDESDNFDPEKDVEAIQRSGLHNPPAGLEAQLCGEALAATSFNSNSIANALDLFDLANDIRKGDIFDVFSPRGKSFKQFTGDAWLQYRYVYSTTKSDLAELMRYAGEGDPTVMRAGQSTPDGLMHVKIMARPRSSRLGAVVKRLTEAGVAPNLYNMWDLVPFSFVVDWFVDVGGVLEGLTQYGRCAAYDVQSVTTSWKWKEEVEKLHTKATLKYYKRFVSPTVPPYVPYVGSGSASDVTKLKRVFDAVALIG